MSFGRSRNSLKFIINSFLFLILLLLIITIILFIYNYYLSKDLVTKPSNNYTSDLFNRYSNEFSKDINGNKLCLNTTKNNQLKMKKCNNNDSQKWITKPIENMPNFYNIQNVTNQSENNCVDIINDGINNKLQIASCDNYSGQQWLIPNENSTSFQNNFSGMNNCLDIINDGVNNQLIMNPCGYYNGQIWSTN